MNTLKVILLMGVLSVLMVVVGQIIGGGTGAFLMLILSLGMNLFMYWNSDKIALKSSGAVPVSPEQAPELYEMTAELTQRAHLPMPAIYVIPSEVPNAFATGRNPEHAAIAVTTGIMQALSYEELSGVLGHELTHVKNRDILIQSLASAFATCISWIGSLAFWFSDDDEGSSWLGSLFAMIAAPFLAMLLQLAISRSCEYRADKGGGEMCGNPEYLASALEKIEYYVQHSEPMPQARPAMENMYIVNPLEGVSSAVANLMSTHPSTDKRIARLHEQAQALNRGR